MMRPAACLLLIMLALAPACQWLPSTSFPYGMSLDKHNFVSTEHTPLSLTLVDTTTGETVWVLDIPVGRMAVVDFEREKHWNAAALTTGSPASRIEWAVVDPSERVGNLDQSLELSGNPVLLKVAVREEDKARPSDAAMPLGSETAPPGSADRQPGSRPETGPTGADGGAPDAADGGFRR